MTPLEESLVNGSSRRLCFNCGSGKLRPLIVLAKEGFPPGDERHVFAYTHNAIFGCDDCHHGYAERRDHDCYDFEDLYDQDQACPIDAESIAALKKCLPPCPDPLAEKCACEVHKSLRQSWGALPAQEVSDFPPVILHMADADQERLLVPRVAVEIFYDLPFLVERIGEWKAYDEKGNLRI